MPSFGNALAIKPKCKELVNLHVEVLNLLFEDSDLVLHSFLLPLDVLLGDAFNSKLLA